MPQESGTEFLEFHKETLERELATLKKLYNDLAESHAKQVIEIEEFKSREKANYILISNGIRCARESVALESELLKAKERFCQCNENDKTGSTSAMHCNHCGKIEQSETWLK